MNIPSDVIPVEISWQKSWKTYLEGFDPMMDSDINTTLMVQNPMGGRALGLLLLRQTVKGDKFQW